MPYNKNVFINCPFDPDFRILLRPLIFTIIYLDLEPKIAQTTSSANIRINQIKQHIRESMYGIHDLSRSRPLQTNDLPRFNMPYELGLDIGCAEFGEKKYRRKKILILETERYYYQKVLSDIAGQDIENHNNDPKILVRKVRNWFSSVGQNSTLPSPNEIWLAYNQFYDELVSKLIFNGYTQEDFEEMPFSDYIKFTKEWVSIF